MTNDEQLRRTKLRLRGAAAVLWVLALVALISVWRLSRQTQSQNEPAGTEEEKTEPQPSLVISPEGKIRVVDPAEQQDGPKWDPAGIEDFAFTDAYGNTVTKADLLGHPWAVGFIFTRCAGPCPIVTGQMKILQDRLKDTDVKLVSITVDPNYDTPDVLRKYAESVGADPERWKFLTGDQNEIYGLIHRGFRMPVQEMVGEDRKPGFEILHSINILHVNRAGVVVGKYTATDPVDMTKLRKALEDESRGVSPRTGSARSGSLPSRDEDAKEERVAPAWVLTLPAVNAGLNGTATLLLLWGYALTKLGRHRTHKKIMLTAFAVSIAFLGCYLLYHFALRHYTGSSSKPFPGTGTIRGVYLTILLSHIVLAVAVPVLALMSIYRGLRSEWERHRRISVVTFPIWLYVSVTGVIIYVMLYHWPMQT